MFADLPGVVLPPRLAGDVNPLFLRQLEVFGLGLAGLVFAGEIHRAQVRQVGGEREGGEGSPELLHLIALRLHHLRPVRPLRPPPSY